MARDAAYSLVSQKLPPQPRRVRRSASHHPDGETLHELFPEVPATEARVEQPLKCLWGGKVGKLHITRNFLCWRGRGSSIVLHFSEIRTLDKNVSGLVHAIDIECVAPGQLAAEAFGAPDATGAVNPSLSSIPVSDPSAEPATTVSHRSNSRDLNGSWAGGAVESFNASPADAVAGVDARSSTSGSGDNTSEDTGSSPESSFAARGASPEGVASPTGAAAVAQPIPTSKHSLKPVDLDRVYSMLDSLWKAHLKIGDRRPVVSIATPPTKPAVAGGPAGAGGAAAPVDAAGGAPAAGPSTSPTASPAPPPAELINPDLTEEDVLKMFNYEEAADVDPTFFSPPGTIRATKPITSIELPDARLGHVYEGLVAASSDFLKTYHVTRQDEGFKVHYQWQHPPQDSSVETPTTATSDDASGDTTTGTDSATGTSGGSSAGPNVQTGIRFVSMSTKTPLGRRELFEAQRYWWTASNLTVHCSCQVPGVTYGSNFRTELFCEFTPLPNGAPGVKLDVYGHVLWFKSCLLKGTIQKSSASVLAECGVHFCEQAKQYIRSCGVMGAAAVAAPVAAPAAARDAAPAVDAAAGSQPGSPLASAEAAPVVSSADSSADTESSAEEPQFSPTLLCRRAMKHCKAGTWLLYALVVLAAMLATYDANSLLAALLPRFVSNPAETIYYTAMEATAHGGSGGGAILLPSGREDAQRLLERLHLDNATAVPILYALLEREVHRAMWVAAFVSSAMTVMVGIVVTYVVRRLMV